MDKFRDFFAFRDLPQEVRGIGVESKNFWFTAFQQSSLREYLTLETAMRCPEEESCPGQKFGKRWPKLRR